MNPKVSIVVPCYNTATYLDCCVNSLVRQTLTDIEIILVDDGSPDDIPELCDKWAKKDARIKVVHKQNEGLGLARNSGLKIATGQYIVFLDSDDYIELSALEYLYGLCKEYQLDILRYENDRFFEEGTFVDRPHSDSKLTIINDPTIIYNMGKWLFGQNPLDSLPRVFFYGSACMEMIRHSILKENNITFISERTVPSEDYIFTYNCFKHCKQFGHTTAILYHYRYNEQSLSRTPKTDGLQKQYLFSNYIEQMLKEDGHGDDATIVAMHHFVNELRSITKIILRSSLSHTEKKSWFLQNMNHEYIKKIHKNSFWRKLPIKERIHFFSCYHKLYWLTSFITLFQKK